MSTAQVYDLPRLTTTDHDLPRLTMLVCCRHVERSTYITIDGKNGRKRTGEGQGGESALTPAIVSSLEF